MNVEGAMAQKGDSPYNIKQEDKSGWLWDAHKNRSPGGLFHVEQYKEHRSIRNILVIILNLDQWIRCCVKSSVFSSCDYSAQQSRTGCVVL